MKILLVDDDPIVRECLETLVNKTGERLQLLQALTLNEGIRLASENEQIGLAFVGLEQLRGRDAKEIAKLHARFEHIPVVILAASEEEHVVLQSLNAGAVGFINKAASTRTLLGAFSAVLNGRIHVPVTVLKGRGLYNSLLHTRLSALAGSLFREQAAEQHTEVEVLRLMLLGFSSRSIAQRVGVSETLVRDHASDFLKSLSVTNRSEAMLVLAGMRRR